MNDNTVLNENDYAINGITWIQLAEKWKDRASEDRMVVHDGTTRIIATVAEIKAKAYDSIMARIPKPKNKHYAIDTLNGLRMRCLPISPNLRDVTNFDQIDNFYKFLIEITE
jgi:hypothetical protein